MGLFSRLRPAAPGRSRIGGRPTPPPGHGPPASPRTGEPVASLFRIEPPGGHVRARGPVSVFEDPDEMEREIRGGQSPASFGGREGGLAWAFHAVRDGDRTHVFGKGGITY